ncbi:hypothetical protein LSTR_LSTR004480 [Laodelphax striatellus]|uniref:Uncharacterized protein n=1 Tax=Laodelphax striatellus TaxID=195883 RepID=A0A482XNJ0_LAOST|nr:hypothetical protein LSTR_LSTR004480 [Laodelphax striatellus]
MDTIRIKEEIPFEQEDEVEMENIRIKDELETGQEGEEEDCNTIYIKVEEPCENEERDNYTQKAETSEDPLLLNDGHVNSQCVTSNKESHSSISYREQETGEAYNASVHAHQHTLI